MQIGWIDFSSKERSLIINTLGKLDPKEDRAQDELGIGIIRDGYADLLFPGITTQRSRAKYYVLVPYIFAMAERQNFKRKAEVLEWIHKQEAGLAGVLVNNSKNEYGIIGSYSSKREKAVKNKPSSMYWSGLKTFEILQYENLSIADVCAIIFKKHADKKAIEIKVETKNSKDGEGFDDEAALNENEPLFTAPAPEKDFMTSCAIELTRKEAEFLFSKITTAKKSRDSLLAFMLKKGYRPNSFDEFDDALLPGDIGEVYKLAKGFADFIEGAHIRYNVILSRSSADDKEDEEKAEEYRAWLDDFDYKSFDLAAILKMVDSNASLNAFLYDFLKAVKSRSDDDVDALIIKREKDKKQDRAKLCKPNEYRYDENGPVYDSKLEYRYPMTNSIVKDILKGLRRAHGKDAL